MASYMASSPDRHTKMCTSPIHSTMKQLKSTFNSYNLFPDVVLIPIQSMVNVINCTYFAFFTTKMSAQEYVSKLEILKCLGSHLEKIADQVAAVICLTRCLSRRKCSIDLKEIITHMLCSVIYIFHSTVSKGSHFHCPRIHIKQQNKCKHKILLTFN